AITGWERPSISSTRATDFSRPTSKGATAPGKRTALRIGRTASSSPKFKSCSETSGALWSSDIFTCAFEPAVHVLHYLSLGRDHSGDALDVCPSREGALRAAFRATSP